MNALPANIARTQWNNRLKTVALMLVASFAIVLFITSFILLFLMAGQIIAFIVKGQSLLTGLSMNNFHVMKFLRVVFKVLFFIFAGTAFFIHRSIKNAPEMFEAQPLNLPTSDPLYKDLETLCIERGLAVPSLYVLPQYYQVTTAAVVQSFSRDWGVLLSAPAAQLTPNLRKALLAQAVQRAHTRDTLFLTLFCFLAHFPFHLRLSMDKFRNILFYIPLAIADRFLALFRPSILNLRLSRLDMGALELTKDADSMRALFEGLSGYGEIEHYYHEPYLSLFIAKSDDSYRLDKLTPQ